MSKVTFNRETKLVAGIDRDKLPFELEIQNVDVTNTTKQEAYLVKVEEMDSGGRQIYLLPVQTEPIIEEHPIKVETIEDTNEPVMIVVPKKVPVMENGEQVSYRNMTKVETTEVTDEPVLVQHIDEDTGETIEVQKTNENDQPLYLDEVYSEPVLCWTVVEEEVQKGDEEGNPLYYKEEVVRTEIPQEETYEKILETDERWADHLPKSLVDKEMFRTVTFEEHPEKFTFEDVVAIKQEQVKGTMYLTSKLYEQMDVENLFSTNLATHNANMGHDFVSIPAGGQVRTEKIPLSRVSNIVGIYHECSNGTLTISVGALADDLQPLDKFNERYFTTSVDAVYVSFKNNTDKTVDLHSFAIMS